MRFTRDTIRKLELPVGKAEHFEWDDDLPGFGVRLRGASKRWTIQYRAGRQQRRESLGDIRKVTLEDAQKIARNRFAQVELGTDPGADRARAKARGVADALTLAVVADRYIRAKKRRPSTMKTLKRHLHRVWAPFGDRPIGEINRREVAALLQEIVQTSGAATAGNARANLSGMYSWAMREGLVEANPVSMTNDPAKGLKPRDRVLSDSEIGLIWRACEDDDFGRAIKLLFLTGARREEIGGLQWSEIDQETGVLTIPGERIKNHRALVLPLPLMAMNIVRSIAVKQGRGHVFGTRGAGVTGWGYYKLRLDTRIAETRGRGLAPWTVHDIRRTMRTGLGKIGVAPHIAELVINHVRGGVEAIYDRHRYEPEIKAALAAWAAHILAIVGVGANGAQSIAR